MSSARVHGVHLLCATALGIGASAVNTTLHAQSPSPANTLYSAMRWRMIGPFLGGRVETVAGVRGQPFTYYFGAVGGGVWKTTDGGNSWHSIFDDQPVASIGAIAGAPSNPNVIYVGTGEPDPRTDILSGDGMYKSTDAGKTWQHIGLDDTQQIGDIVVDPANPNVVLVAALGHIYGSNTQRGVFRSTDGGTTWTRVLYKNDSTGAIDLALDPHNPHIVYAALWQVRRTPWSMVDGGTGSGLYRSADGGTTWSQLTGHGLPSGIIARMAVTVSGADGKRVYALINSQENAGLYRSDDGGNEWHLINQDQHLLQRPWYYLRIYADPRDPNTIYEVNFKFNRSTDGGKSFTEIGTPHVDNHALWIDPDNPQRMIEGNDGGATVTVNSGETWSSETNQPTAQFYHVATDDRFPYYVYGAQQDRGSIAIASASRFGGIDVQDWYSVAGGESGYVFPAPGNPDVIYSGSYMGGVTRYDLDSHEAQDVTPWPDNTQGYGAANVKYRFSWTSPLAFSPRDSSVLYAGSQYVLRSADGGHSWRRMSHDLTRNDKSKQQSSGGPVTTDNAGAEYYDVVYTIAPSPLAANVIWAGTDDGLVHITRDGGTSWHNVTPPGLPAWANVSLIDASHFDAGTAYVAVDAHQSDDRRPYIYRTRDYGATWTSITSGINASSFVHVVREDPNRRGLLFAGTETGVYLSFDDGAHWEPLQLNLPVTSVRDLAVKGGDLVAATHGRGFWILDDIALLEQLSDSTANTRTTSSPATLFAPSAAVRTPMGHSGGGGETGQNPPYGAIIDYYLPIDAAGEATLQVLDANGTVVRTYSSGAASKSDRIPTSRGAHRVVWNLRYQEPVPLRFATPVYAPNQSLAPQAVPGRYTVALTVHGHTSRQPLIVQFDPALRVSQTALQKQLDLMLRIRRAFDDEHRTFDRAWSLHQQLQALVTRLSDHAKTGQHINAINAAKRLDATALDIAEELFQYKAKAHMWLNANYPAKLDTRLVSLVQSVDPVDAAPTTQQEGVFDEIRGELQQQLTRWERLRTAELAQLNELLRREHVPVLVVSDSSGGAPTH